MMTGLIMMGFLGLTSMLFVFHQINLFYMLIFLCVILSIVPIMFIGGDFMLIELMIYVDLTSIMLLILSFWVTLLMGFSSYKIFRFNEYPKIFIFFIYGLGLILFITFLIGNYIMFYFFFEISLIPTFFIIMGWGYQPERLQAGVYFIFYTLTASLPLLLGILFFYQKNLSFSFMINKESFMFYGLGMGKMLALIFSLAFLVKLPMYYTHLWLPKAHVEAPVAGSMILAGVLLKLGGYGIMRIGNLLFINMKFMSSYIYGLSLMGMIYVGLICCRLNDFKALVAYSSVAHMGMVICGLLTFMSWGFEGGILMMISHGIASSGLFCMVNMYYERLSSRSFFINKGLLMVFPIFSMMIFFLVAANIAAPPTINLLSEIFLMGGIMAYDLLMVFVFPLGSFLGAVFSIFMFSYSQHGKIYYLNYGFTNSNFREFHLLFLHIIPVNFLFLGSSIFFLI